MEKSVNDLLAENREFLKNLPGENRGLMKTILSGLPDQKSWVIEESHVFLTMFSRLSRQKIVNSYGDCCQEVNNENVGKKSSRTF